MPARHPPRRPGHAPMPAWVLAGLAFLLLSAQDAGSQTPEPDASTGTTSETNA